MILEFVVCIVVDLCDCVVWMCVCLCGIIVMDVVGFMLEKLIVWVVDFKFGGGFCFGGNVYIDYGCWCEFEIVVWVVVIYGIFFFFVLFWVEVEYCYFVIFDGIVVDV